MSNSVQKIRPAARLLKTIGQDLIKDVYAAIVELVKNSYDADSPGVIVLFKYHESENRLLIRIEDHGHGMDFDTVINKWLVPATDDKYLRKKSHKGRVLQGRKGIGRFAASVLGERILLETTQNKSTSSLILDMDDLDKIDFLDQLELSISVERKGNKNGTIVEIEKDNVTSENVKEIWNSKQLRKLLVELRSLISPEEVYKAAAQQGYKINYDTFEIKLIFEDFPVEEYAKREIIIEPFPVLDLYDYRISGTIDGDGNANIKFKNNNISSLPDEEFSLRTELSDVDAMASPGNIYIDLRVFERDPEGIDNIIKRGLKDPDTGEYVGKLEARKILDEGYGVGVYREQFRIRPYGEQAYDWLDLDKKRTQDTRKIGNNQVIGFVYIRSEEESGLTEKSARDGLTENKYYFGLIYLVSLFINQLETRRLRYREKTLKGGRKKSIEDDINNLFDFDAVTKKITRDLDEIGLPKSDRETVRVVVNEALELEKQKKSNVAKVIKDTIAIYQGQATLGKITHVLLHEGRKHIKYITETVPRVVKWAKIIGDGKKNELMIKLEDRGRGVVSHAKGLSHMFKKIEPLARTRRSAPKNYNIENIIDNSFEIFLSELNELEIKYQLNTNNQKAMVFANEMDLITVFSNLIENSIYWLKHSKNKTKSIFVNIYSSDKSVLVDFRDSGSGFQGDNLELMFEPGYSMKPDGTGLGLALAGEAMSRIGGVIEAKHSDVGAAFNIVFKVGKS